MAINYIKVAYSRHINCLQLPIIHHKKIHHPIHQPSAVSSPPKRRARSTIPTSSFSKQWFGQTPSEAAASPSRAKRQKHQPPTSHPPSATKTTKIPSYAKSTSTSLPNYPTLYTSSNSPSNPPPPPSSTTNHLAHPNRSMPNSVLSIICSNWNTPFPITPRPCPIVLCRTRIVSPLEHSRPVRSLP